MSFTRCRLSRILSTHSNLTLTRRRWRFTTTSITTLTSPISTRRSKATPIFRIFRSKQLLAQINKVPENIRTAVRNNGGGHMNHSMFWKIMKKGGGGEPTAILADAIKSAFGSFADFKTKFNQAATTRFGSGWAWLLVPRRQARDRIHAPIRTIRSWTAARRSSASTSGSTPTT